MITNIDIHNFRCFQHTTGKDFSRINLLGGKNNAGKTALLEALLLLNEPNTQTIFTLLNIRGIGVDFIKSIPQRTWDNLFYNQLKTNKITIQEISQDISIELYCDDTVEDFMALMDKDKQDDELLAFSESLSTNNTLKSVLHINTLKENQKVNAPIFVAASNGLAAPKGIKYHFQSTNLIPANSRASSERLATLFDTSKLAGNSDILLTAFQLIDDNIEKVETLSIGKPAIYVKRKGENSVPLTLFGDAMNKVADFILRIINNKNSVILIDEIENGIHHTNQEKLWEMLFKLAQAFDVQVFATTHSAEMITAFKNVGLKEEFSADARYFEMARHEISNEITINKIPLTAVENKLFYNKPLRGE